MSRKRELEEPAQSLLIRDYIINREGVEESAAICMLLANCPKQVVGSLWCCNNCLVFVLALLERRVQVEAVVRASVVLVDELFDFAAQLDLILF